MNKDKKKPEEAIRKKAPAKKMKTGQTGKSKPEHKLRVLILEDNPADAELMERQLRRERIACQAQRIETRGAFSKALMGFTPDIILADYTLPKFNAMQALAIARKKFPYLPFIIVTGSIGEEEAVACLRAGADDYLLKDRLARLGEALRQALEKHRRHRERENMGKALLAASERWRTTFDSMRDAVCLLDGQGAVQNCNRAMNRLLGLPYRKIIGRDCLDLVCGARKRAACAFTLALRDGRRHEEETFWRGRWYQVRVDLIPGAAGEFAGAVHVMTDISERKQAEELIKESLAVKEVLLKEIHHRVKNNLQIISGLLSLQAEQIEDEGLQRVIKDSQSRIWTMSLIHQMLYQSGNLAAIDMADYIRVLSGNMISVHAQRAMAPTVIFDLLPLRLGIDKSIPLALILNELVINAIKHAFPDGRPGEIRISLQERRGTACRALDEEPDVQHEKGTTPYRGTARRAPTDLGCAPTYELTVADNGVGLSPGFDPKNQKSLGLQLVTMLTKQLGGTLAITPGQGTAVTIAFKNEKKEN